MTNVFKYSVSVFFTLFFLVKASAQSEKSKFDTSYIEVHPEVMGMRTYLSHKFTDLNVNLPNGGNQFRYEPNSGLNMGLGFTYQNFTLNIAGPIGFLNPDRQKDWPKYWDLQVHAYPQKWIIDFLGQFYTGYTIDPEYLANSDEKYLREDMKLVTIGLNANYLFNGERLSLASSFNQASIQKKSAFSPFIGFEAYGGSVKGDSLLIPSFELMNQGMNFDKSRYFLAGPNAGLAGTLVFGGGFFLTGVASVNLSGGFTEWQNQDTITKWGVIPTYFLRGFAGFNNRRFSVNVNYVYKNSNLVRNENYLHSVNTGNYRVNLVYKISVGPKFERFFAKINPTRLFKKN